ncbi:MAG: hypothetical protein WCF25_02015 [Acidimicrobiales bacterium]
MIEISRFRLADDVASEAFLEKNAIFQQEFIYQQAGLLRRSVASGLDGVWVALTWWRSMSDARRCHSAMTSSPVAKDLSALMDLSTLETEYFKELPG